jgi:hypothetical protein
VHDKCRPSLGVNQALLCLAPSDKVIDIHLDLADLASLPPEPSEAFLCEHQPLLEGILQIASI